MAEEVERKERKPELRFKGFEGEWEYRGLKEIVSFSKGRGYSKGDLIDSGIPIILYGRLYTQYQTLISNVDTFVRSGKNAVYSKGTEVIVPASGESAEDIARASAVAVEECILGGDLNILHPSGAVNPIFLALSISNGDAKKELEKSAQGKSIVHLHNSDLEKISIHLPNLLEQESISNSIQNLDTLITHHQQKHTSLQNLKKAMLEKMFPRDGADVPEIRFKGFEGAWERVELGKLAVEVLRKAPEDSTAPVMMISAASGFINQSEKYSSDNAGSSLKNYTLLKKGELAYNHGYSKLRNYGSCFELTEEEARVPFVYHSFSLPEDDATFYSQYLNCGIFDKELKKRVSSTARMDGLLNISYESYMTLEVCRPCLEEQQKIASYFQNLDNLISQQQKKIEHLKYLKSALLEKMFVSEAAT